MCIFPDFLSFPWKFISAKFFKIGHPQKFHSTNIFKIGYLLKALSAGFKNWASTEVNVHQIKKFSNFLFSHLFWNDTGTRKLQHILLIVSRCMKKRMKLIQRKCKRNCFLWFGKKAKNNTLWILLEVITEIKNNQV